MTRARRWAIPLAGCLLLLSAAGAFAQDWPQWRGPGRDGIVLGFQAPETWPSALTKVWTAPVGIADATPALVGDKVYSFTRLGGDEVTACLNVTDGSVVWQDKNPATAPGGPAGRHPGPRCSPAVADGKVVTVGVNGVLSCLDAASGAVLWRKDPFPGVVPQFFTSSSPIIMDGMAIAHLGGKGNGALIAFDLATGEEKWRWAAEGPDYASPVVMTADGVKQIVTLSEKSVVGVSAADGKLLWQIPFAPQGMSYNIATPIVDGQTVIYGGAGRGTSAVRIEKQGEAFVATPVWSNADIAAKFNTPVLQDGLLFGMTDRGNLFCLDAVTGAAKWRDEISRDRGGFGAIVGAGPVLLCLPSSGELIAFGASGDAYRELAKIKVADTPTYATPVVSGKRILVQDQTGVTMWTLP